jgi:hypothetical protein
VSASDVRVGSDFELDGYWWVPDETEARAGHLTFSPATGARLRLLDWFSGGPPDEPKSRGPFPIFPPERLAVIHGETLGGVPCSLLDAICDDWYSTGGHSREVWSSNSLIHGVHLMSRDDLKFDQAVVKLRGLKEWLVRSAEVGGVMFRGLKPEDDPGSFELRVAEADVGLYVYPEDAGVAGERIRRHAADAQFDLREEVPLDVFRGDYLTPLEELVALGTRETVVVESLTAFLPPTEPDHRGTAGSPWANDSGASP